MSTAAIPTSNALKKAEDDISLTLLAGGNSRTVEEGGWKKTMGSLR